MPTDISPVLSNARKFIPKGASIRVDIRQISTQDGVHMRFTTSDTGIGSVDTHFFSHWGGLARVYSRRRC